MMFLLFCFNTFYPRGGWSDFVAASDDLFELKCRAFDEDACSYQIVDAKTLKLVEFRCDDSFSQIFT